MLQGLLVLSGILFLLVAIAGIALYFSSFIAVLYMLFSGQLVWAWLLWSCFILASIRFLLNVSLYRVTPKFNRKYALPVVLSDFVVAACFGLILYAQPTGTPLRVVLGIFILGWAMLRFR
jgi:hypothetical protein